MDRWCTRSAAIGCAFAACAMVVGPGVSGTAVAHADLLGIDFFDIFDDQKSDLHHPRPGSEVSAQTFRSTDAVAAVEAPTAKVGSAPENLSAPASISDAVGGVGGGGGIPRTNIAGRAGNLPRVSSAPVTRSIVIRGPRQANADAGAPAPAFVPFAPQEAPAVVPLAAPPPIAPVPESRPAPGGPPAPSPLTPVAKDPLARSDSGIARIPDSFRVGYAEYLRSANSTELFTAALPGVAGIAGFTLLGAYAGYRQARAVQAALLPPVPTQIVL